jgi:RHS repeat-associated protein
VHSHPSAARHVSLITIAVLLVSILPTSPALARRSDTSDINMPAAFPPIGPRLVSSDPGTTLLISQSGGVQGDGDSELPAVSADGRYVAFQSAASNLVVPDPSLKDDIFVADRTTGALSLSSVSTSGVRGDGHSFGAAISADGRYVAFASFARNLADDITTPVGKSQIYRRDRTSGITTLVSAGLAGAGGNGSSGLGFRVAISADGQFVAYDSIATDLISPDANSRSDTFVWDAASSATTLVSLSTAGVQGDGDSSQPSLSGDGRYVAYESFATNLTTGGTNGQGQIYVRDRTASTTTKVSISTGGAEGNAQSRNAAVSADGRFIAFDSTSTNLTADPKFFATLNDVYARDQTSGTTVRVSLDSSGLPVNGNSKDAAVSSDGTRISFTSDASFGPPDPADEIYVRNQTTGEVVLVSVSSAGAAGNGHSENSSISGDGLVTAFRSLATNLVTPPTSGRQIFVNVQSAGPVVDFGEGFPFTFGVCGFCVFSRDPVNLATGSLTSHADDLVLPGRMLPFAFTRWYNSADAVAGPLGPGWTHSYNWKLTDGGATVEVRRGDGRRDTFTRNPDTTYANPPNVFDTLVKNGDGTFTLTLTSQVQYEFTATGQLTRLHEPAGNQVTLAYTGANLTGITDTVGRQITLAYDGSNLAQLEDPLGRKVTYGYDANGRLSTVTDKIGNAPGQNPALHRWTYGYDGTTRHIATITDPDGRVRVTNAYDAQGRVHEQRDALNKLTRIDYSAGQTVVTDPRLHATTYTFDARMRVLSQADTVGTETFTISYVYDAAGNRESVTDRNDKTTDFTFDTRGNVLTKTDPEIDPQTPRYVTTFAFDTKNNLRLVTDARGFDTTLTYGPTTNVLLSVSREVDAATSTVTKYEYTDAANPGLPTKVIAPRGNTGPTPNYTFATSLAYDAQGNLTQRIDPDGAKTTFAYDGAGRLASFVDPDGYASGANPLEHTWRIGYDENDRETSRTDPLGNVLGYGYDGAGNRRTLTDRRGNITTYGYDPNTRLETVKQKPDPVNQPLLVYTTDVDRDDNGNATRITQANGVITDYVFDALDRLTSVKTYPDAQTTLTTGYALDGNGQPTSRTTGDNVTVNYIYDALSRLSSVSGPSLSITYDYNPTSQRTEMVDATGTTTYQYDGLGRVTQVAAPNGTLTYVYDLDGNRTTLGYPGSQNVTYAYSPGGRLNTVTDWASRLSTYTYKPSGLVATLTYPNTMLASYEYDRAQRLKVITNSVGATTITQHSYTLDAEGNREALDEYVQGITQAVPTWSPSVQVNTVTTNQQDRPDMAIGADGATYLVWDDTGQSDVFFSRRDPTTGAWSANQRVNDTSLRHQTNAAIAVDGSNNAYAVWQDTREGNNQLDANIYFSKRSAATGLWSANVRVNHDTSGRPDQISPEIAVRSTGDAVAVWVDRRSNQWNVYSSRLVAGGSSWGTDLRVTDNTVSRKFTPDVAVGADGTAYAVWEDDRSGNMDIWFSTLPAGSSTWTANVKISDDPGTTAQYDAQIGISAAGDLIVIWQDDRVPNTEVRMRRRLAGQSNWQASTVASDAASIPVSLALGVRGDGNAFAAWQDARGPSYNIWGADYTFATNTWSVPEMVSDDPATTAQMRPAAALSMNEVAVAWRDDRVTGGDIRARRRAGSQGVDHFAYAYDGLNRLLSAAGPVAESFAFDGATNVTSRTGPPATNSYDASSRQISDGVRSFTWNPADRLIARGTDTFVYDASGTVTRSTVAGTVRDFTYTGTGLLASAGQSGFAATPYLWDSSLAPARLVTAGPERVVYGVGALYRVLGDGSLSVFAQDALGSVRAEVGPGGAPAKSFRYSAYGGVAQGSVGLPSLLGYAGELLDGNGLVYLRARWYDPVVGRFLSRDPELGVAATPYTLNGFGYVAGNPILNIDPSGRFCLPCAGAIIGGLAGLGGYLVATAATGGDARLDQALIATAAGALSGAACTGGIIAGCVAISSLVSVAQYQLAPGAKSAQGYGWSAAVGALGGRLTYSRTLGYPYTDVFYWRTLAGKQLLDPRNVWSERIGAGLANFARSAAITGIGSLLAAQMSLWADVAVGATLADSPVPTGPGGMNK